MITLQARVRNRASEGVHEIEAAGEEYDAAHQALHTQVDPEGEQLLHIRRI